MATKCFDVDGRATKYPIARKVVTVTIANGQSVGQANAVLNGHIERMIYDVPDLTGVGTLTVDLLDEDTTNLYSKAAIPENAKTVDNGMVAAATPNGIAVVETVTIKATASAGAQTGDQTIKVIMYIS